MDLDVEVRFKEIERRLSLLAVEQESQALEQATLRDFMRGVSRNIALRFTEFREWRDSVDDRFDAIDRRFEAIDRRFDAIDRRFDAIDQRLDGMDRRFDGIDRRFDAIDPQLKKIDEILELLRKS